MEEVLIITPEIEEIIYFHNDQVDDVVSLYAEDSMLGLYSYYYPELYEKKDSESIDDQLIYLHGLIGCFSSKPFYSYSLALVSDLNKELAKSKTPYQFKNGLFEGKEYSTEEAITIANLIVEENNISFDSLGCGFSRMTPDRLREFIINREFKDLSYEPKDFILQATHEERVLFFDEYALAIEDIYSEEIPFYENIILFLKQVELVSDTQFIGKMILENEINESPYLEIILDKSEEEEEIKITLTPQQHDFIYIIRDKYPNYCQSDDIITYIYEYDLKKYLEKHIESEINEVDLKEDFIKSKKNNINKIKREIDQKLKAKSLKSIFVVQKNKYKLTQKIF